MRLVHHRQRHSPHDDYAHGGPEEHDHPRPSPPELQAQAEAEYPDAPEAIYMRYAELMVGAGLLVLDD